MDVNVFEYSLICPQCKTKTVMIAADMGVTLFTCEHCKNNVMLHKGKLFSIREKFLKSILTKYRSEPCGSVIFTRKYKAPEASISDEKIKSLKKSLDSSFFIDEFLEGM